LFTRSVAFCSDSLLYQEIVMQACTLRCLGPTTARSALSVIVAIFVCTAGCGKSDNRVTVSGTVTVNGQPLTRGIVWIHSDGGNTAQALLNRDGSFTATEVTPGGVTLAVTEEPGANDLTKSKSPHFKTATIPGKYKIAQTSGLRFMVGPDSGPLTLNLE
jgi:hypothetical protein